MRETIFVGSMSLLRRKLGAPMDPQKSLPSTFMGIPVETDPRIPEGVWVLRKPGGEMSAGSISKEYREEAETFSRFLHLFQPRERGLQ